VSIFEVTPERIRALASKGYKSLDLDPLLGDARKKP